MIYDWEIELPFKTNIDVNSHVSLIDEVAMIYSLEFFEIQDGVF